jgi:hypothetical protein
MRQEIDLKDETVLPASETMRRQILAEDQLDDVGAAVIALAREVYVVTDRLRVLEQVLEDQGISVHEAVERYQVSPELQSELDAKREHILGAVLKSLRVSNTGQR